MKTYLKHLIDKIRGKFWLVPLLFLFLAGFLAWLNINLDKELFRANATPFSFLFSFHDADSLRALLGVVGGSVLGVTGVAFSITIASLTLASQQFGPRLLRNFMYDRFNQIVIGFFIGTFLYCVFLMQFTNAIDKENFTPVISMTTLLVLVVIDLLLLVFFIHHTAISIQADNVIASVYEELHERLQKMFSEKEEEKEHLPMLETGDDLSQEFENNGQSIYSRTAGYLQAVDVEGLRELASNNDLAICLNYRPGDFIVQDSPLSTCLSQEELDEKLQVKINQTCIIGKVRTPVQDIEFAIRQLEEVALRALSPGINDPFTAVVCIHWLGNALAIMLKRDFPPHQFFDEEGHLRLQIKPYSFSSMLDAAFAQIQQFATPYVAHQMLDTLKELRAQTQTSEQQKVIDKHIQHIKQSTKDLEN